MKQEKLAWLADNPFYTKCFAFYVGRRCRTATVQDVAGELCLDWKTVKELDKQYMGEQLRRVGPKRAADCGSRAEVDGIEAHGRDRFGPEFVLIRLRLQDLAQVPKPHHAVASCRGRRLAVSVERHGMDIARLRQGGAFFTASPACRPAHDRAG